MTNCSECHRDGQDATVVAVCMSCGAMLCEQHRRATASAGPGGTRLACGHAR